MHPTMTHPTDFADAHRRHWEDAELLFEHDRWANADQLYGLSAECGLKAVMLVLEIPINEKGRPPQEYRKHVQDLWPVFETFAGSRNGARFLSVLPADTPFDDWSHHNRYAAGGHFRRENVEPHRAAARGVIPMVQIAMQSGHP